MHVGGSKRYNHDGLSFKSFASALSWPYCAHFPAGCGVAGKDGAMRR